MRMLNICRITPPSSCLKKGYATQHVKPPIIKIKDATFYRQHPSSVTGEAAGNHLFQKGLTFELPSFAKEQEHWAILGPSSSGKSSFLQILRGQFINDPPLSRSYPYLSSDEIKAKNPELRIPSRAIQYVGFGGEQGISAAQGTRGAYLSARYESLREATDWTVLNYLEGHTEPNSSEELSEKVDPGALKKVIKDLRLGELLDMPVANLSNGQTRRAKIARAILEKPEVLLLDEVLMGLDPPTLTHLSPLLHSLSQKNDPRIVLTLRHQDPIPDWVTKLCVLETGCNVALMGPKSKVLDQLKNKKGAGLNVREVGRTLTSHGIMEPKNSQQGDVKRGDSFVGPVFSSGEPLVEMEGVTIAYGSKAVLGNWKQKVDGEVKEGLHWTVRRGQRWGILGPNGSGKTTLLSLICSDHPQTYSQPVKLFGRSRLPEPGKPGISIFDIQSRIGHSSPEIHHHIPRTLSLRQVLENAWSETFLSKPKLDDKANLALDKCLQFFEPQLRPDYKNLKFKNRDMKPTRWASDVLFRELPFSAQRVALFLRAIIKKPDLVILDESFSGMDEKVRDKCMNFLAHGESKVFRVDQRTGHGEMVATRAFQEGNVVMTGLEPHQALLCISHVREEIPGCVRDWICLPEAITGKPPRFGKLAGPLDGDSKEWNQIWGM